MDHDKENFINYFKPELEKIFSDKKQVIEFVKKLKDGDLQTLISNNIEINEEDSIISYNNSITTLIHYNKSHKELLENYLETSQLNENIKENIREFLKIISSEMINKFNFIYLSNIQLDEESNKLIGFDDQLIFRSVYDDKHKIIGQIPIISLKIKTNKDEDGKEYLIPMKDFENMSNIWQKILSDYKEYINAHKDKFDGDI